MNWDETLVLELLTWIASRPRTYAETMDAWRTTCPRQSAWEDAWMGGLIQVVFNGDGPQQHTVTLTALGRSVLDEKSSS